MHNRAIYHCNERLKLEYLASQLQLSTNYVGEYFRKLTGQSLQQYITLHKRNQIEQR